MTRRWWASRRPSETRTESPGCPITWWTTRWWASTSSPFGGEKDHPTGAGGASPVGVIAGEPRTPGQVGQDRSVESANPLLGRAASSRAPLTIRVNPALRSWIRQIHGLKRPRPLSLAPRMKPHDASHDRSASGLDCQIRCGDWPPACRDVRQANRGKRFKIDSLEVLLHKVFDHAIVFEHQGVNANDLSRPGLCPTIFDRLLQCRRDDGGGVKGCVLRETLPSTPIQARSC